MCAEHKKKNERGNQIWFRKMVNVQITKCKNKQKKKLMLKNNEFISVVFCMHVCNAYSLFVHKCSIVQT